MLLAQHADVIALVEAEDPAVLERIARRLKMDYVQAIGKQERRIGTAQPLPHSRFDQSRALNPGISKSLLQASIDRTGRTTVALRRRPSPRPRHRRRRTQREAEFEVVMKVFEPLREAATPHFLFGDFNSNSPVQQIDLAKCKPSTREQAATNGGTIPRRVVQELLNAGYADTYHLLNPELAKTRGTFTTQFPGQRVDYIFAHSLAEQA